MRPKEIRKYKERPIVALRPCLKEYKSVHEESECEIIIIFFLDLVFSLHEFRVVQCDGHAYYFEFLIGACESVI